MSLRADRSPLETGASPGQQVLVVVGLTLVAIALVVPFAENEQGCLDHCYEAARWYVWNPLANLGAPFLAAGIVMMAWTPWGRPRSRRRRWAAAACGWFGVLVTLTLAPEMVQGYGLYGGPDLRPRGGGVIVSGGYAVLFVAAWSNLRPRWLSDDRPGADSRRPLSR